MSASDPLAIEEPYTGPIMMWRLVFQDLMRIRHDAGSFRNEDRARDAAARMIRNARKRGLRVRTIERHRIWQTTGKPGTVTRFDAIGSIELFEQDVS